MTEENRIIKDIIGENNDLTSPMHDLLHLKDHFNHMNLKIDQLTLNIKCLEDKIDQMFDILHTFHVMLEEQAEYEDSEEDEEDLYGIKEWNPYDDNNEYDEYEDDEEDDLDDL